MGPSTIILAAVFLFVADHLAKFLVNPTTVVQNPKADDSLEVVDKNANRSIAVFSIVLVVIRFSLPDSANTTLPPTTELAIGVFLLSAAYLVVSFVSEMFAAKWIFVFNLQLTAVRYAGLLLFSGTYLLLISEPIAEQFTTVIGASVAIGWGLWAVHEIHYIFWIQKRKWNNRGEEKGSRSEYIYCLFSGLHSKVLS